MMWRSVVFLVYCAVSVHSKAVTTKLEEFTQTIVYSGDKAEVERAVKITETLSADQYHTVTVHGFTENVMDETIRIASEEDVEVLDVKISTVRTPRANMPEYSEMVDKFNEQLKDYRKEFADNLVEYNRYDNRMKLVTSYVTDTLHPARVVDMSGNTKEQPSRLPLTDVTALLDYQVKEQEQCHAAMQKISVKQTLLNEKIDALAEKLQNIQTIENYPHEDGEVPLPMYRLEKVLTFRIKLATSKKTDFSVSYMTTTASWSPEYDIRIESKSKTGGISESGGNAVASTMSPGRGRCYSLEIDYFANVVQNTGESWTDTPLVLSTANPAYLPPPPPVLSAGTVSATNMESSARGSVQSSGVRSFAFMKAHNVFNAQESLMAPAMMVADAAAPPPPPKVANNAITANSIASGDIGASHKFKVVYPVSVESTNLMLRALKPGTEHVRQKHLILVDKLVLDTHLYTFAVPSQKPEGFMVSLSKYELTNNKETKPSPLLASSKARLHIQGDNIGTVKFRAVQPGEMMKLNLGVDKNIHITTTKVVPKLTKEEEDKSTWFFKDKRKFRVRTEERLTTIRSSYPSATASKDEPSRDVLVIVAESLPRSMEVDEVSVELLSSNLRDAITLDGSSGAAGAAAGPSESSSGGGSKGKAVVVPAPEIIAPTSAGSDAFIEGIVARETKPGTSGASPYAVYYCKITGNLYWAVWVKAGESVTIPFKYKITWPEDYVLVSS